MTPNPNIFRRVMWFDRRGKFDLDGLFELLQPKRKVSQKAPYKSGRYYSEKCKREIQYESSLELDFIDFLEHSKKVAFYYDQPITIKYRRGRKKIDYTPDLGVYLKTGEFFLVEVKPLHYMQDDEVQCKMVGLMDYCSHMGFGMILTDGRYTFADLKKIKLNRKLEREILKALERGPIYREDYLEIKGRCGSTHTDLQRVILKHDLYYRAKSLRLRHGGFNPVFRKVFWEGNKFENSY